MGQERLRVGLDGAAVKAGGIVKAVLGVGRVAQVEESARVGGVGGKPGLKLGLGSLPIGFHQVGFGLRHGLADRRRCGGGSGQGRLGRLPLVRGRVLGETGGRGNEQAEQGNTKHEIPH